MMGWATSSPHLPLHSFFSDSHPLPFLSVLFLSPSFLFLSHSHFSLHSLDCCCWSHHLYHEHEFSTSSASCHTLNTHFSSVEKRREKEGRKGRERRKREKKRKRGNRRKRNGMEGKEESEGNLGHGTLDINFFPLFSSSFSLLPVLSSFLLFKWWEESHLRCEKKMRRREREEFERKRKRRFSGMFLPCLGWKS